MTQKKIKKDYKVCLVCSSGGHLLQLMRLKSWWKKHKRFWVTFNKQDAIYLLKKERTYWAFHPTTRNILNLIRNFLFAFKILLKEKPDIIISSGAGVAVPFFYTGKLLGAKLIFVEAFTKVNSPLLTGRIVYPVADSFLLQWEGQKKFYPQAELIGPLL